MSLSEGGIRSERKLRFVKGRSLVCGVMCWTLLLLFR